MNDCFLMDPKELIEKFKSDENMGLSQTNVCKNRIEYGANTIKKEKRISFIERIFIACREPMTILLIFAVVLALTVNIVKMVSGKEADYFECAGIFIAIILSVLITVIMESRSQKAFESINNISKDISVKVRREGNTILISSTELVAGDIVFIEAGCKIPADGRLIKSVNLSIDESALTGESLPVEKMTSSFGINSDTPLAERANMVYSGCFVTEGHGEMVVCAVGEKTEFGKIAKELSKDIKSSTPLQEKLKRLSKTLTIMGISAAFIAFIVQIITHILNNNLSVTSLLSVFVDSIALIVASVPEGLPTIVAVSLAINIIKMSKENALVKKMIACETIGSVNIICSDKTGTLTKNKMSVAYVGDKNGIKDMPDISNADIINNFCLNSTADVSFYDDSEKFIGNPTECALLVCAGKSGIDYKDIRKDYSILFTIPFSSQNKKMTTVVESNKTHKTWIYVKGSPEKIFDMCIPNKSMENYKKEIEALQEKSLRVIAFAHLDLPEHKDYKENCDVPSRGFCFDGFAAIEDPLREDVKDAVLRCKKAGISLKILTGDNIITAKSIANRLGILSNEQVAIEAQELENLSDAKFMGIIPQISVIARSTPSVKLRVVNALKSLGNVVAVTGDGINDAPAIKNADVGIAMGITGTEVSKEAGDIVLLDDSFSTIVKAIHWGRNIYENIKRFITFQLTVNVSSVISVLAIVLLGFDTPFSALQLLWINIIMDGPPALSLGLEPIKENLMQNPPKKRSSPLVSNDMLFKILINATFISSIFLCQYFINFLGATKEQMSSVLFSMFVIFQLFNAFNCREPANYSIFRNIFKNKMLLFVFLGTFLIQVLITQYLNVFFGTVALPFVMWGKITLITSSVIVFSELVKLVLRLKNKY